MRLFAVVLMLVGVAGVAFGILTIMAGSQGLGGQPFGFENYGGPGPILAGLLLIFGGLYLRSLPVRRG